MKNSNKFIVGLVVVAIVIGLGMYLSRKQAPPASKAPELHGLTAQNTNRAPVHVQRSEPVKQTAGETTQNDPAKLRREKIDEYLRLHHRDTASLLAAFHALQDTNFLREAATNFPNDPRVQWTVLARNVYPEERRKWLDNFKAASPSNSLANYLSAQDYFKDHKPDVAMKELAEASGKSQFADYSMETIAGGEDLSRFTGSSPVETYLGLTGAVGNDLLPESANLKGVASGIKEMQQQFAGSGDTASVQALAQTGITFANHLTSGDSGKLSLNQLVGMTVESAVLDSLDPNTPYDFLGGKTPAEKLAEFAQARTAFMDLQKTTGRAFATMSDEQAASYWNRVKTDGETEAKRWLVQQNVAGAFSEKP
jgi:hypothetical protein